jgi:hypothetical protein
LQRIENKKEEFLLEVELKRLEREQKRIEAEERGKNSILTFFSTL